MPDLATQRWKDALKQLLQVPGGISGALIRLEDGFGRLLPISLSSGSMKVHGDLEVTGSLVGATTLSDNAPQPLGGANGGTSLEASRSDHVHAVPSAAAVGAQPLDQTLTALAALDPSAGLLEQAGADVFVKRAVGVGAPTSVLTRADGDARYLTNAPTITLSGDAAGVGSTAITMTLATVNANVGTFGSSTSVPVITTNGKGLITNVTTAALGAMAAQAASSVAITGGTLNGVTIGGTTAGAGTFTTLSATSGAVGGASIVTVSASQTLTNKTLTAPVISTISNTGTLTLPTSTDTLVGRATTDTLTNKTLSAATLSGISTHTGAARGVQVALTDAATISWDMALGNDAAVTLGGNRTLGAPTNVPAGGQGGSLFITQDGTGSRTLSYNSVWKFRGGTAPTLSTAAGAVDRLDYTVKGATSIHAVLTENVK